MKLTLTHKEANLVMAILWELGQERALVVGGSPINVPMWRLTNKGAAICEAVMGKLEEANNPDGIDNDDLSGAPKGTIQDAVWK